MKQCPFRSSAGMNVAIVNANAGSNKDTIREMLETAGACRTDCQLWDADRQECKLGVMAQALNSIAVETKKIRKDQ